MVDCKLSKTTHTFNLQEMNKVNYALNYRAQGIDPQIVRCLRECLDGSNKLVKEYRMTSEILANNKHETLHLRLIRNSNTDLRQYNYPTASEVAACYILLLNT